MMFFRNIFILLIVTGISACANFSAENLFSDYASQNSELHQSVQQGDYSHAQSVLNDHSSGDDILLSLEKGRVSMLNRDFQKSLFFWNESNKAVQQQQQLATISLSREATSVGSLFVNDNLNDYVPADYELGFLHLYQALSYVHDNQLEDALVEIRQGNQVQKKAKQDRQAMLVKEQEQLKEEGIQPDLGSLLSGYPDAGENLKAVQNGYLFYLSALLYEAAGDLNDAYVDYRRALAVAPENKNVILGTMRTAGKLGMKSDLSLLKQRYGHLFSGVSSHQSRVIVLQEQGVVDMLQGWQQVVPVFGGDHGVYSLALPYYQAYQTAQVSPVHLNQTQVAGELLTDVNLMARQHLRERIPSIVIRQILRLIAKNSLRHGLSQKDSKGVVNFMMNVWNVVTEHPDTRSWLTLPASVYSATQIVPAGEQKITVGGQSYQFNAPEKETVLVWVSRQGNHAVIWHKILGKL